MDTIRRPRHPGDDAQQEACMLEFSGDTPVLVFGGPYSNLEATTALIAEARRLGIGADRAICTGDVVAYGAAPEETARTLAAWGCHVIQGNCEQKLAARAGDCGCNFEEGTACAALAKGWYPFADTRISDAMRTWMSKLPETLAFTFSGVDFRVVHGGTSVVNRWVFQSDVDVVAEECAASGADVTIAGHCGLPFIARADARTWFNPGVVGLPANDGTSDVWYGLVSPASDGVVLSTHRLSYDHLTAAGQMRRHGHANGYARTLVTGHWPSLDVLPAEERLAAGKRLRARRQRVARRTRQTEVRGAA
jgi:predicted phosphodiesterase